LATRAIRPRVTERISFDEAAEAHRRLEAGGLEDLPSQRDLDGKDRVAVAIRAVPV
jgi:hypothetical protein